MKRLLFVGWIGVVAAWAPPCVAGVTLDQSDVFGVRGHYAGTRTDIEAPLRSGLYRIGAQVRTFSVGGALPVTKEEYIARLTRELYHVSVTGWLGTAPPNTQSTAYHLAGGEAVLTLYGLRLGPVHPELSLQVWESSGPAPLPESLDRTWVTRARAIYNNINNHLQGPSPLVVVENYWQFELSETWRDRTQALFQAGGNHYNRLMANSDPQIYQDIINFPGIPFAVLGWPNNNIAGTLRQRLPCDWTASFSATRLNLYDNGLVIGYDAGLEKRIAEHFDLRIDYAHLHQRGSATRDGLGIGVHWAW